MTAVPPAGYPSNSAITQGAMKTFDENILSILKEVIGVGPKQTLTLNASGQITPVNECSVYALDTYLAASAQNLDNFVSTNMRDGGLYAFCGANSARAVTFRNNQGASNKFILADGVNFLLEGPNDWILMYYSSASSGTLTEVMRSSLFRLRRLPGNQQGVNLSIVSDELTPTQFLNYVDPEGGTGPDNCQTINWSYPGLTLALFTMKDASETVVWKHSTGGAGKIYLRDNVDLTMNSKTQYLLLERRGVDAYEIGRFGFTAKIGDGGTNNASLGVANNGILAGDGSKVVQVTGTALQQFRVNAAGNGIEAFSGGAGGIPFGGDGSRALPTSGSISGTYMHAGNWTSTGTLTVASGTRIFISGTMTLNHDMVISTAQAGGAGGAVNGAPGQNGNGPNAGQGGISTADRCGGGGGGCGGAGGAGGSNTANIRAFGGGAWTTLDQASGGSSGGGGGATAASGTGGAAGGFVYFEVASTVVINGNISAHGGAGVAAGASGGGGGGAGSGGVIDLRSKGDVTINATKTVGANGGVGGNGNGSGGNGAGGGGGIVGMWSEGTFTNNGSITVTGGAAGTGGSATQAAAAGSTGITDTKTATGVCRRFG